MFQTKVAFKNWAVYGIM